MTKTRRRKRDVITVALFAMLQAVIPLNSQCLKKSIVGRLQYAVVGSS